MDRLAQRGNPEGIRFPRPMLNEISDDFSFSGLKTAVRYFLREHPDYLNTEQGLCDLCASVQAAIMEVLVVKTVRAARRLRVSCVTSSGGVSCNRRLRHDLTGACQAEGLELRLAEPRLCTDNAAMVGILAERKLRHRVESTPLGSEVLPGWQLA
jgi:N6-L-threonylcarbamoyladenine synthase